MCEPEWWRMDLVVLCWSSLCLRPCRVCSLEQQLFFHMVVCWTKVKPGWKMTFSMLMQTEQYSVWIPSHTKLFLEYFRSSRSVFYSVLSCGCFAVTKLDENNSCWDLVRLTFLCVWKAVVVVFFFSPLSEMLHSVFCRKKCFLFSFLLCFQ